MFTIQQIKEAHSRVKSGADFPAYIQELKALGVSSYELNVADGHFRYSGEGDFTVSSAPGYALKEIAAEGDPQALSDALKIHQQGQTDYLTFCQQAAAAGVEQWVVSLDAMTCTYYDRSGGQMIEEMIPG